MFTIREATAVDALAIRELFLASYGTAYPDPLFYDVPQLTRMIYSEDALILVAEEAATGKVLGTASVLLDAGAYSDLIGEFGRLAVHPDARRHGLGALLMEERLRRVQGRLHVGFIEARTVHPYALRIAEAHHFAPVGFLPLKMVVDRRESLVPLVRHFGDALALRRNHPRVLPEVHPLAHLALENCGLPPDLIVDEEASAYSPAADFAVQELTTEGYAALLRIERGRVRRREIFGPLRLHYGFFKIKARKSRYLIAREGGRIVGAVGYTVDEAEQVVRIFELIALHDPVVRCLLADLERRCRAEWAISYVEVDVSAHAPRMQRTLLELNFLPAAYLPALVFDEVERLDVVRMVRLLAPLDLGTPALSRRAQVIADEVLRLFASRAVLPRIAQAVERLTLFAGLAAEQVRRLAGMCRVAAFAPEEVIFRESTPSGEMHILLSGEAAISREGAPAPVDVVRAGECLGELSLLTGAPHSATATARTPVETAVLSYPDLAELVRLRPDIGLQMYRNLALGLGQKLKRSGGTAGERA
jgi:GNAT superfamily N-acetyltransferase